MSQLFKNLLESKIDRKETKEEINKLSEYDIKSLIEDIFWRYDFEKAELKTHVQRDLINEQKLIFLVSDFPYYLNVLLEEINGYKSKKIYCKDLSLVKYLKVNNKENFLKILNKITCVDFFIRNYDKFEYNLEEQKEIQNIFDSYVMDGYAKLKISVEDRKKIFNKTGLLVPFLLFTDLYEKYNQEEFEFFVEHYKYCSDHEVMKYVFLGKNKYNITKFKEKLYELFVEKNKFYIKDYPEKIKKDIEDYIKVSANKEIINGLGYMLKLTEKLFLKYEMENF